jgi:hypothetical protein
MRNRTRRRTVHSAFLLMALGWSASTGMAEPVATPLPELVLLAPGTTIRAEPPPGWSALVLKSLPKLESGDLDTLPSFAGSTATHFRSLILADVRPTGDPKARYRLARIGLGLCVPHEKAETVVTREHVAAGHVPLGLIERQVLQHAEDELKKARLIARGPRFAVLATPSMLLVGEKHEPIHLLYAFCVDPSDGQLESVVWGYSTDRTQSVRLTPPALLPPRLVYRCGLDVQAERLLGALPVNWSFAMRALPPGTALVFPDPLQAWLISPSRIAEEPLEFERLIRAMLASRKEITSVEKTGRPY